MANALEDPAKARMAYKQLYDKLTSNPSLSWLSDVGEYEIPTRVPSSMQQWVSALAKPTATVSMREIIESTDAVKQVAQTSKPSRKGVVDLGPQISDLIAEILEDAKRTEGLAASATSPDEASDSIAEYYRNIAELQVVSGELRGLTNEAVAGEKDFWERISGMWDTIKQAVRSIGERIKGVVGAAALSVLNALEALKGAVKNGIEAIGRAVDSLAHLFYELVVSLIRRMFDFTARISVEAKKRGFAFKELSLEFPTLEFDFIKVATFSIPIPKSVLPKLTISFGGS